MNDLLRLKHVFSDYLNNGIFAALEDLSAPWSEDQTALPLDILYIENHSGDKIISPMVRKRLNSDNVLTNENISTLAGVLLAYYGQKWMKLWDVLLIEYNPLSNYDMVESGSNTNIKTGSLDRSGAITKSGSESVSDELTYSGKESNKRSGSVEDSGAAADNSENSSSGIYGYNSQSAVPADTQQSSAAHKNTQTFNNVTDERSFTNRTDSRDIVTTYTNRADTDSRKDTYNNITDAATHSLTRKGNIGVTTSQQMLESEIEVRKWLYFENVMQDIDKLLTLSIY